MHFSIDSRDFVKLADSFGKIRDNLPKLMKEDLATVAETYAIEIKKELAFIFPAMYFTGQTYASCKVMPAGSGFQITLPGYAVWHAYAKTGHVVGPDTEGREPLDRWYRQKTGEPAPPFIRVKPLMESRGYSWLQPPIDRAHIRIIEKLKYGKVVSAFDKMIG